MDLTMKQITAGLADGSYHIRARGCIAASLHWADETGALPDWQSFGYVPIGTNGEGNFFFRGGRAIPEAATHVLCRAVSADFATVEEAMIPIPMPAQRAAEEAVQRYLVMTDLHLSNKPWPVRKALLMAKDYDCVLITGDMTNDGAQAQLERFWGIVSELVPDKPVFVVTGNHDYEKNPLPWVFQGLCEYPFLQQRLLDRAEALGIPVQTDGSGAYAAGMGDTAIIGLNAANHWRRFKFPENAQLHFLEGYLRESDAKLHLILCHAPLANHRPYKEKGEAPYLARDKQLQQILESSGKCFVFLSGHTHVSMSCSCGCVDRDEGGNVYVNAGSIRPTALKPDEPLQPECWTEGNVVELVIGEHQITVTGISLKTGQKISRGHYRETVSKFPGDGGV